jgi:hypothetical protein
MFPRLAQLAAAQKLALSAAVTLIVIATAATCLRLYGVVPAYTAKTWGALVGALIALAVKWIIQGLVKDDHMFQKQGYDLCVMSLSTSLTAFVAVFVLFFFGPSTIDDALKMQTRNFGVLAAAVSIVTGVAALIMKNIDKNKDEGAGSLIVFVMGSALFIVNVYIILTK